MLADDDRMESARALDGLVVGAQELEDELRANGGG